MKAIPLKEFPSSFNLGEKVTNEPKPGITTKRPPETPLLQGIPISRANLPAPLYIPHVIIIGTTEPMVLHDNIRYPFCGLTPLLANKAPNLASDLTSTKIEHN